MPAKYRILLYPAKYKNGHQHPRLRLPASFLRPAPSRFFATTYADRRRCFRFRFLRRACCALRKLLALFRILCLHSEG